MSGDELRRTFVDLLRWVRERVDPDEAGGLPAEAAMDSLSPGSAASAEGPEEPAAPSELPAPPRDEADVALDRAGSPASGEPPSPEPAVPDVDPSAGPLTEPSTGPSADELYDRIVEMLHTVFDPEIPVDIYELGLVYGVDVLPDRRVSVRMTLTSPSCPSAQQIPEEVQAKVESVDGVVSADVEIVWEPQWTPEMMSEEARLELNL